MSRFLRSPLTAHPLGHGPSQTLLYLQLDLLGDMETFSKQDTSPATGCLRMCEYMCSSGQGLLHSSIVKSLAQDVAGFSRPVRWYSEPLQLMHISIERANLVPALFPQDLAGHPPSLWHIWRRLSLCDVSSTWRHCHLTPGQEKTETTRRDSAFG